MSQASQGMYLVVDTETTGINAPEDKAVEVAAVLVKNGQITAAFTTYLNPGRDIPAGASGVHGLVAADVEDAPTLEEALPWLNSLTTRVDAVVAHNAPFDKSMLPGLVERRWLDTLRLAKRLLPELESYKNQTLRYELNLHCPEASGMPAHRALADAYVTARLLVALLQMAERAGLPGTIDELIDTISNPMVLHMCNFGKHKGLLWSDVPKSYLSWLVKQEDFDIDVLHTAKHHLGSNV